MVDDKLQQLIDNAVSPDAMAAFIELALGTPAKKTVTNYVVDKNPDTGRPRKTKSAVVVTEQKQKPDRACLVKVLQMVGELPDLDSELKEQKIKKTANDDAAALYEEAEELDL